MQLWGRGQWALACAKGEAGVAGVVAQAALRSWGLIRDPGRVGVKLGGRAWILGSGSLLAARGPGPEAREQPKKASVNQVKGGKEPSPRTSANASSLSINSCHQCKDR